MCEMYLLNIQRAFKKYRKNNNDNIWRRLEAAAAVRVAGGSRGYLKMVRPHKATL